ncbi:MAG: FtsH protease activity modulator HflK [Sphingomonadales bacterium]|nr:FtsH protease activity modulator HflK [Sphingomonadales bacterium]
MFDRWKAGLINRSEGGGPWGNGNKGSGGSGGGSGGGGPRNPWEMPPGGPRPKGPQGPSALDEVLRRLRDMFGGGDGQQDPGPILKKSLLIFAVLWVVYTSVHRISPQEEGVVTRLGAYQGKLSPGVGLTLPAPFDLVEKVDVQAINTINIPRDSGVNLVLTGDQNIIDLAYSVRWDVRDSQDYKFQLAQPDETIREVAESAMREVVGTVSLNDAVGAGRGQIETRVTQRMQVLLNEYRAGVNIQGVAIKQAVAPKEVNDAFNEVTAAQQGRQAAINNANAYAQQIMSRAQGEATAFDKVYEQYRLAPQVTRRRMYYETMESILPNLDKTVVEPGAVAPYLPIGGKRMPAAEEVVVEGTRK